MTAKSNAGRKQHQPTEQTVASVRSLVSFGIPIKEVAAYIGIDDKTLSKHYGEIMTEARGTAKGRVGRYLFQAATGDLIEKGATHADCLRAAMFYAKTQMGFRETHDLNHMSEDGSMTPTVVERVIVDPANKDT
jgi:hypothetical protein